MLLTEAKGSAKIIKSDLADLGYLSSIMYLAPYKVSGYNTCASATEGCIKGCLNTAGRGVYNSVQAARIRRTKLFFENRPLFTEQLFGEIDKFNRKAKRKGKIAAIRLNGTSDIVWEQVLPELFTTFSDVQWYDYTKHHKRMVKFLDGKLPSNYHLTFSRSENNHDKCLDILSRNGTIAAVFRTKQFPKEYFGYPVYNADETDLRFLDKPGVQALYAKGKAKRDDSGFVINV